MKSGKGVVRRVKDVIATKLNVFNSTSLAIRSMLEALRLAEGMKPRTAVKVGVDRRKEEEYRKKWEQAGKPQPAKSEKPTKTTYEKLLDDSSSKTWTAKNRYEKMNINR